MPAPVEVAQLGERLTRAFAAKDENVSYLAWRQRNTWGGFSFHAHRLDDSLPSAARIGVIVQYHGPLVIRLWRRLMDLSLSRRQTQLCVLIASGLSYGAIAKRLKIAESTVIDHSRQLYAKLDVHNHVQLLNKLLWA